MIVTASGPMDMACDVRVVATVPNDGNNPVFVVRFGSIDYSPEWNAHHAGRDISVQAGSQSVGGSDGGGFVNRRVTVYSDLLLTSSSRESTTITVFAKNAVIDESLGKNGEPWFNVRASVGIRLICPVAPVIEKTYFGDTLELMALSEIDGLAGGNLPDVVGASVGGQLTATVPEEHGIVTLDGISGLSGRVHVATPDNEHTEFVGNGFGFTFAWSGGAGEYAFEATALEYAPSHYFFVAIAGYDDSRFPVLQDPMA